MAHCDHGRIDGLGVGASETKVPLRRNCARTPASWLKTSVVYNFGIEGAELKASSHC